MRQIYGRVLQVVIGEIIPILLAEVDFVSCRPVWVMRFRGERDGKTEATVVSLSPSARIESHARTNIDDFPWNSSACT